MKKWVTYNKKLPLVKVNVRLAEQLFRRHLSEDTQQLLEKDFKKQKNRFLYLCLLPAIPFGAIVSILLCLCAFDTAKLSISATILTIVMGILFALLWCVSTSIIHSCLQQKSPSYVYDIYFRKNIFKELLRDFEYESTHYNCMRRMNNLDKFSSDWRYDLNKLLSNPKNYSLLIGKSEDIRAKEIISEMEKKYDTTFDYYDFKTTWNDKEVKVATNYEEVKCYKQGMDSLKYATVRRTFSRTDGYEYTDDIEDIFKISPVKELTTSKNYAEE